MDTQDYSYWLALAHLPKWGYLKINNLIIKFFHEEKISIEDFFNLPESTLSDKYQLDQKDISDLQKAKSELPKVKQNYQLFSCVCKFKVDKLSNNNKITL